MLAGGAPLLAIAAATRLRTGSPRERALVAVGCAATIILAIAAPLVGASTTWRKAYVVRNPTTVPTSMNEEGRGPKSPFFPSSADTNVKGIIPADFFTTSASCARCHQGIYDEWKSSMHHFSSFNNQWYRKSIEYMQDVVGTKPSKWCAGCHDHAVFFNGRFDRPIKEQIDTPEAQAGLACTSCHSITHVRSTMGQGDFEIEYPPLHDLAASTNPALEFLHDKLTFIDPQPHREAFMKPFHTDQTPEFCSSCHKVHLDAPVNSYRWFRGFNDYDNWQASGVSGEGARSFYYPKKPSKCADCHMPLVDSQDPAAKNGKVRSHRFAAANTAVPFANHDAVQLKAAQDFLRDGQISVDIFGLVRTAPRRAVGGDPLADRYRAAHREHIRGRRRVDELWRGTELPRTSRRRDRSARQSGRGRPPRRFGSRRRGRADPQGRSLLPRRHGRCVRRLGRARSGRRKRPDAAPQRRRGGRRTRPGRSRSAFL